MKVLQLSEPPYSSNSYWVGLGGYSAEDVATAFDDIKGSGATTVRTWRVIFSLTIQYSKANIHVGASMK